jgi:hypothetical protein
MTAHLDLVKELAAWQEECDEIDGDLAKLVVERALMDQIFRKLITRRLMAEKRLLFTLRALAQTRAGLASRIGSADKARRANVIEEFRPDG